MWLTAFCMCMYVCVCVCRLQIALQSMGETVKQMSQREMIKTSSRKKKP